MKLVMTWMLSAEPWLYEAVVHERQYTYHGIELSLELRSIGAKDVSTLPSRCGANSISGGEQLPKSTPPESLESEAANTAAVEFEEVWHTGQERGATTAYDTDLCH